MATGAAPALEPKVETKNETTQPCESQPATFKQRLKHLLHEIFEGREEYLGWHQ